MQSDLVFVIGPSGSGIRTAIAILEDLHGYAAVTKVDPTALVALIHNLTQINQSHWKKLAIHVGMRRMSIQDADMDSFVTDTVAAFEQLKGEQRSFKIVFLYCSQSELLRRQDYGFHPLKATYGSMAAAIFKECEVIVKLFLRLCDDFWHELIFIDTSNPKPRGIQVVKDAFDQASKEESSRPMPGKLESALCTQGWNQMRKALDDVRKMIRIMNKERQPDEKFAEKDRLNCLLLGESGTGKETIAKILHEESTGETEKPFVTIDCAAIPEALIESELFGSVPGAFTDAIDRAGKVRSANGGVLFIDEIGLANKTFQAKLLRLIEEREYRRVGYDGKPDQVDCRIVAATSRNLDEEVKAGNFLLDLFQRLDGVSIVVPPLRERREDIRKLLDRYLHKKRIAADAMAVLFDYDWPGNARELRKIAQLCNLVDREEVHISDLPPKLTGRYPGLLEYEENLMNRFQTGNRETNVDLDQMVSMHIKQHIRRGNKKWLEERLREAERQLILEALEKNDRNKSRTAKALGIERPELYRKLAQLGIKDASPDEVD